MKILIIGFAKIKYMPYLNLYLENIDATENEVHILYWNRDLVEEDVSHIKNATLHEFRCYQEDDVSKLSKIGSFFKFRHFAKTLIKKNKFDFLITLTSVVSVLLSDVLLGKYKNQFFYDYRDVTYEKFPLYKRVVWSIVEKSCRTFVSSDAFRGYFPQSQQKKICTTYNLLTDSLNHRDDKTLYGTASKKIRIAFWGFIRHEEVNRKIIRHLVNDERFELHYYGREQETAKNLKSFAESINGGNIFFHGEYKPEDRYNFIKNTDIIHNIYDDSNMMLAMGNKFYDGMIFKIPQICTEGSFMGKTAEKFGIGKAINPDSSNFSESIYEFFISLDKAQFENNCDNALKQVLEDNKRTVNYIKTQFN